jgi:hypothetical protein
MMRTIKIFFSIAFFTSATIFFSCTSTGASREQALPMQPVLLPLQPGWYQYDFENTVKGIEDEYNFAMSTGMKMVQEITWKYTGVVCRFEDGVLYDPVSGIELSIAADGQISCTENISIRGTLEKNGRFFWSGLKEEHGRLNSLVVKGTLTPLPASVRGGREYNGVYCMIDSGTGREILANISDGFYTWRYIDGEEAGFTPWPMLIQADGSFSSSMDITTVMEMGDFAKTNYSTGFEMQGKVIPGQGISMEEVTRSTGLGQDQGGAPQTYVGTILRSGEIPNEAIPADIENLVRSGRAAVKAEPKPNRAQYPSWYLDIPVKSGFIYAAGEKTFANKETALAMAEAAAAANIAEQLWVRIESSITDITNNAGTRTDERSKSEALQRLNYRIVEQVYNEQTHTAFVLAETEAN